MEIKLEECFNTWLSGEGKLVNGTMHTLKIFDEVHGERIGELSITLEGSEFYKKFPFAIWGETLEEAYLCLPTYLEDSEDDELEDISLMDMVYMELCNLYNQGNQKDENIRKVLEGLEGE